MNEKTKKFNIYKLLTIVLAAVLVVVLGVLVRNWYVEKQAQRDYDKMVAQVNRLQEEKNNESHTNLKDMINSETQTPVPEDVQPETEVVEEEPDRLEQLGIEVPGKNLDWESLRKVNSDIYAWIYIPGTNIDYPVLQHLTDDSYYLHHNMNGSWGYPGCIYTERLNSRDFTDFDTVLYGHNMHDDSMFATLHAFENPAVFDQIPYVYIYTEDKVLVYEIFAAYVGGNEHILYNNDFSGDAGRMLYLGDIMKYTSGSAQRREVELATNSHILTLSTCIKGQSQNRYLVQAVLLNEEALAE